MIRSWFRCSGGRRNPDVDNLAKAEEICDQALQEAQHRFRSDREDTLADVPPMLTAASVNAAECHARRRNRLCAASLTREALDALCTAMCDTPEQQALRIACFHHLKPALFAYAERAEATGVARGPFQQTARQTRYAALIFLAKARYNTEGLTRCSITSPKPPIA